MPCHIVPQACQTTGHRHDRARCGNLNQPALVEQAIQSKHRYLRGVASLDTPPAELAAAAIASLPLKSAATVLMYIEGAPKFSMPHIRNYVIPIVAEAPSNAFIKYFVEVDPGMPEDALAINLYVRTDHPIPGEASHAPFAP